MATTMPSCPVVSSMVKLDDELPEDIDDERVYVSIPHKHDLNLGKHLALAFTENISKLHSILSPAFFVSAGHTAGSRTCSSERDFCRPGTTTRPVQPRMPCVHGALSKKSRSKMGPAKMQADPRLSGHPQARWRLSLDSNVAPLAKHPTI